MVRKRQITTQPSDGGPTAERVRPPVAWRTWLPVPALLLGILFFLLNVTPASAQIRYPSEDGLVGAGYDFSCAVTNSGGVKCWGVNLFGQLGDNGLMDSSTPVDVVALSSVVAISSGNSHTCAVTSSGGVKCWGNNGSGQLGNGNNYQRNTATDVQGLSSGIVTISAGSSHTCALTSGGGVKCWGDNSYGQLGDGTTTPRNTPVDVQGLSSGVVTISAGSTHTCAVMSSDSVKCWGSNVYSELGDGTTTNRSTPVDVQGLGGGIIAVSAGYQFTCAVVDSGGVKCWGDNLYGQLGDGTTTQSNTPVDVQGLGSSAVAVSAGSAFTCAVMDSGSTKCWGYNESGQLGMGSNFPSFLTPVDVVGLSSGVTAIALGDYFHSCVVTGSGDVKCWGLNDYGQLGTNDGAAFWYIPGDVFGLSNGGAIPTSGLRIMKSGPTPYPPVAGQPVSYNIVVTNTGSLTLTNVTVTDEPAPSLTMTAFTSSPAGACNTTTRQCTLNDALAPGGVATFSVTFDTSANAGAVISNTAYVTADQWQLRIYPEGPTPVTPATTGGGSGGGATTNLKVTKSTATGSATAGTSFDYTITVSNLSNTAATNVRAVDTLPAGVTFTSASAADGGSCSHSSGVVTCTWGNLAGGVSTSATITVTP